MNDLNTTVKDALYVAVGFGVIAVQRAQVRRREVEAQLGEARVQVQRLAHDVEQRVEPVIEQLEERLPTPARDLVRQARSLAGELPAQVRSLLGSDGGPSRATTAA